MSHLTKIKMFAVIAFTALTARLGALAYPVYVMVGASILDYITGLWAAPARAEKISSYKGIRGIVKKVCMWLLVPVGAIVDWLLLFIGMTMPFTFPVAIAVALWIIANELISILENFADIGVPLPHKLVQLVSQIKDTVEGEGDE